MSSDPASIASPTWREEWVPLPAIIKHPPWQVRVKLDERAVNRYAEMTRAGSEPPPIRVARVKGHLYLVDGWHRMQAGALQVGTSIEHDQTVKALVANLTQPQAIWEAARANLAHGVQYKGADLHGVFKAFVKSKQHLKPNGGIMSYREIAPIIGRQHTTIRNWMIRYFPKLAAQIGGVEHGNPEATQPPVADLGEEHKEEALDAVRGVSQRLGILTPEARWIVLRELEGARELALKLGVKEPPKADF